MEQQESPCGRERPRQKRYRLASHGQLVHTVAHMLPHTASLPMEPCHLGTKANSFLLPNYSRHAPVATCPSWRTQQCCSAVCASRTAGSDVPWSITHNAQRQNTASGHVAISLSLSVSLFLCLCRPSSCRQDRQHTCTHKRQ